MGEQFGKQTAISVENRIFPTSVYTNAPAERVLLGGWVRKTRMMPLKN